MEMDMDTKLNPKGKNNFSYRPLIKGLYEISGFID